MRFNKNELVTLATQPAHKFDKEGILLLRERQESFFRRTEIWDFDEPNKTFVNRRNWCPGMARENLVVAKSWVAHASHVSGKNSKKGSKRPKSLGDLSCYGSGNAGGFGGGHLKGISYPVSLERWCRLRGNLLFYFKSRDQWSEPVGVLVLEQCTTRIDNPETTPPEGPFGFSLDFEGGSNQHLAARSDVERTSWLKAIESASYYAMWERFVTLQKILETRRDHNPDLDVTMWRLRSGIVLDPSEIPLCDMSFSCDNLLCDASGRPPNAVLVVHVYFPSERVWVRYGRTEVVERSSNPCFLSTLSLRASDGLDADTRIRFTVYDVREPVSHTAVPLGCALVSLRALAGGGASTETTGAEVGRLRIALRSNVGTTVGFLSIFAWGIERNGSTSGSSESTPCRQPPTRGQIMTHRRSHSLPPRLGSRLKMAPHCHLSWIFASPYVVNYRFHSGLCGDIFVTELMAESQLCFSFPCQLLSLWIQEEKELLQEVAGMGELKEPWHDRQLQLLDRHLQLLHLYSQAQEHLQSHKGSYFKPSSRRDDRSLEFAPVNLHLQRMWAQNDTLNRSGLYDVITVGAFTAHSHKSKNGGLIRLLQQLKESPSKGSCYGTSKMNMARDAIQAIKQLRREVVEGMRSLIKLAACKQTAGMLPICEDMITKTRSLLSLWDAGLVEEALAFVDEFKVAQTPGPDDTDDFADDSIVDTSNGSRSGPLSLGRPCQLSPFKRITQQLHFELKSPDVDVLATPDSPRCTRSFWDLPGARTERPAPPVDSERQFVAFPDADDDYNDNKELNANTEPSEKLENGNDHKPALNDSAEDLLSRQTDEAFDQLETKLVSTEPSEDSIDGVDYPAGRRGFLDTRAMCSSPSANYYKPTDEPEPWDLTQLNIEASVMCLVSKVKFLCGRCSSPAVRLRSTNNISRSECYRGLSSSGSFSYNSDDRQGNGQISPEIKSSGSSSWQNNRLSGHNLYKKSVNSDQTNGNITPADGTARAVVRNKFTEGLDLGSLVDWTAELRPAMRKLRTAMDGLLKTARLMHSAFRTQQDPRAAQRECNVRYRRDVCFSQALTALVTALMSRLWYQKPDPMFLLILATLGPLATFEGLLSLHGAELDMWGDMTVAVEDLSTVTFTLTHPASNPREASAGQHRLDRNISENTSSTSRTPQPRVVGSRAALTVFLPVPDGVMSLLPLVDPSTGRSTGSNISFRVTPVFFNIGINDMATLAESLGLTGPQHRSNLDSFSRLHAYFLRFRKLRLDVQMQPANDRRCGMGRLSMCMTKLKDAVHSQKSKNVEVLQLAERVTQYMQGLRFTSCKSAKDRTGMAVTLEQVLTLSHTYDLAETEFQRALDCTRRFQLLKLKVISNAQSTAPLTGAPRLYF